jgi:hypothetical protein
MYKQNRGTPEKPKAVSYFNQFPSNFLKPYGRTDSAPDDDTISRRTNPISCEWFLRPRVAMSEFPETMTENLQLLQDEKFTLVNTSEIATISDSVAPMLDALSRLNTKTKVVPTKRDINTVMTYLYDNEHAFDKSIEEMIVVGGAMFTTAIQYLVARSILSQPTKLADKLALENDNTKDFKRGMDVKALRHFLERECLDNYPQTSSRSSKLHPRRALLQQLRDDSDDDDDVAQEQTRRVRKTTKRTVHEDSDSSASEEEVEETAAPKRKKSKKSRTKESQAEVEDTTVPDCHKSKKSKTTESREEGGKTAATRHNNKSKKSKKSKKE